MQLATATTCGTSRKSAACSSSSRDVRPGRQHAAVEDAVQALPHPLPVRYHDPSKRNTARKQCLTPEHGELHAADTVTHGGFSHGSP